MNADQSLPHGALSRIDDICTQFEEQWKTGTRPDVEAFLNTVTDSERAILLEGLLELELFYRQKLGESLRQGEYNGRFPDNGELIAKLWEKHGLSQRPLDATVSLAQSSEQHTIPPLAQVVEATPIGESSLPPGYELIANLGEGGMGRVYKARHLKLNRIVALKELLPGTQPEKAKGRFGAEAEAIALLQHPNVVEVFDLGEHEGRPYLALEFCGGGTLAEKIKDEQPSPKEAARIVEMLAGVVQAAHQVRVIHRELKPANVLLTETGELKVTDFGLAKRQDVALNTVEGDILGTPSYMAPEQAGFNDRVGAATDVYGLGAILYELLTGRPPFQKVIQEPPTSPRRLNRRVPKDLETICLKCLEKEPSRRYQHAEELGEELERYREDRPIAARPIGPLGRAWRWTRRYPTLATMTATIASLLVFITVGALIVAAELNRQQMAAEASEDRTNSSISLSLAFARGLAWSVPSSLRLA